MHDERYSWIVHGFCRFVFCEHELNPSSWLTIFNDDYSIILAKLTAMQGTSGPAMETWKMKQIQIISGKILF